MDVFKQSDQLRCSLFPLTTEQRATRMQVEGARIREALASIRQSVDEPPRAAAALTNCDRLGGRKGVIGAARSGAR